MSLPLTGLRIVSVEQYGAGPFGTQHLADLGAEVIKIENPHDGGDVGRAVGPHYFGPGDSHFYQAFNRNKKSVTLNLKHDEGRQVLHDLCREADAVFNNLRGDLPGKLGLTYEALREVRQDIVCVHLSAYGREGERASWPGYDYLMQAETGYLSLTGEPDGPPSRFGLSVVDLMTGTTAALGLVSAVLGARQSGVGRDVDVSLFDVALHTLGYVATWYLNGGHTTGRAPRSGHPSLVPSQLYRTADGWIFIMCNKEKFWPLLAQAMDHPEWAENPNYRSFKDRLQHRESFNQELEAVFMTASTEHWMTRFAGRVPAAPVYDVAQALDTPFVQARECLLDAYDADGRPIRSVASPIRCPGEVPLARAAPAMGVDTEDLLAQAGYGPDQIARLRKNAVL
ncbi:CaiB/BaiF CoA transferase family protein [Bordetella tumulicola]|uniref:CaiB/BaiF CoA transferase family protein n=1 Tax=Bordetella tumulicola TaxID=1649133 RepID=UPI0039EEA434